MNSDLGMAIEGAVAYHRTFGISVGSIGFLVLAFVAAAALSWGVLWAIKSLHKRIMTRRE